jgi:hypothetical protein
VWVWWYAGKSWEGHGVPKYIDVLVHGVEPFGDGIVKMAVSESSRAAGWAMMCHARYGPEFGYGFGVKSSSWSSTAGFDEGSGCLLE